MDECSQFTIGNHSGEWYHNQDEDVLELQSGEFCHKIDDGDEIHETVCGDLFHDDEMERRDIVQIYNGDYAYRDDATWGYVGVRYSEGYFLTDDEDWVRSESDDSYFINSRVANWHDVYYYDSVGEWRHCDDAPWDEDEEEEEANPPYYPPSYTRGTSSEDGILGIYHRGGGRGFRCVEGEPMFTVGFEIEKEDGEARNSCSYLVLPHGWTKERDASLNSETGYELIGPVYDLFGTLHEEDINGSELLQKHINGGYSKNCGGHIHVASKEHSVEELFEKVSGFFPVLYSLYVKRLDVGYSEAKKKHEYLQRDKRSSIYVRGDTLEFRIFPAVKNVTNLYWRVGLLRIIMKNLGASERDVLAMLCDSKSELHNHIASVVGRDNMMNKVSLFVKYSSLYNDVDLNGEDTNIK